MSEEEKKLIISILTEQLDHIKIMRSEIDYINEKIERLERKIGTKLNYDEELF